MSLRRCLAVGAMLVSTVAIQPALADVKAGVEAWQKGNYLAAVAQWRPLAERRSATTEPAEPEPTTMKS